MKKRISRRDFVKAAGLTTASAVGLAQGLSPAANTWAASPQAESGSKREAPESKEVMAKLSTYIVEAAGRPLPEAVSQKARHHVLDTLAAMVSGSRLKPGSLAIKYIRTQGGTPEAQVIGADFLTTAVNAAMANGFMAHADETDDSHAPSITHPGRRSFRRPWPWPRGKMRPGKRSCAPSFWATMFLPASPGSCTRGNRRWRATPLIR